MKARKSYTVSQLVGMKIEQVVAAIGQMLDSLFAAINRVSVGPLVAGQQAGQMDGVFLVAAFTGTVNQTFAHSLARAPVFFVEVFAVLTPAETAGTYGEVQLIAATSTTVTLRCQTSGKTARLILF